jgi:polyisoprenyl-phosphate glycosyltransferase
MSKAPSLTPPSLSIVVPCYNEEECLSTLYERVTAIARAQAGDDYELVLINDGSRDKTWPMMEEIAARDPRLVAINLSRNHGHQLALTAGLDLCRGDLILILDADLQDPPELLPQMITKMRDEGADVVYAVRGARAGESFGKKLSASIFYRLLDRLTDTDIPLDTGDFRLMSRRALNALLAMPEQARFIRGMVAWIGFKQVPIFYDRQERLAGETKYPFARMMRLALDAITGFSTTPLRLASHLGIGLAFISILLMVYIFAGWLSGNAIQGWTSMMLIVVMLGAAQMFVLGMIGEYLGRLYMESKKRPLYIVAEIKGASTATATLGHCPADAITTSDRPGGIGNLPTS